MSYLMNLYFKMPNLLQSMAVTYKAYQNKKIRQGSDFNQYYNEYMQNMSCSLETLKIKQKSYLLDILNELNIYSTYYSDYFRENDIKINNPIECIDDIVCKMPLMTKDALRTHMSEIVNLNPSRTTVLKTETSGTTGTPMQVEVDSESLQRTFAQWERYYRWMGLDDNFTSIRFSGRIIVDPKKKRPPFWVKNFADNQLFMSTYHLTVENMAFYVKKINSMKPNLIDGYPSAIYVISKYINDHHIKLDFSPIAISTTAETLHDYQREEIERAFKCKVYNQYASSEGAPWIVECKEGNYHEWIDTGYFEKVPCGEDYKLVISSFRSLKTPLIRYDIGDIVKNEVVDQMCNCGSEFPLIGKVVGRDEDILFTDEKGFVGRLDTAYKGLSGIFRSKIIQNDKRTIDVYIVPDTDYTKEVEKRLKNNLIERLGDIEINIYIVDDIPLGKNGKFKAVECNL